MYKRRDVSLYSTISESRKIVSNIEGGIVMKKEFKEMALHQ